FQTDTHWNSIGAHIVLQAAMERLGLGAYRLRPLRDYRIEFEDRVTDLLRFLNIGRDVEHAPALVEDFSTTGESWKYLNPGGPITDIVITTAPATGHVVVVGDSFSEMWTKFLADSFARTVRITDPREPMPSHMPTILAQHPDVVILEMVER